MTTQNKAIILYPHEYNLRGGEAKASVKGVTHEGEMVTIKLRIKGTLRDDAAKPEIAKFAKTVMEEKGMPCLASPENGPENPKGILIFIECEDEKARDPDPFYRNYYTSRWAYVLRSGFNSLIEGEVADVPFIGMGRLAIVKDSKAIREAKESIKVLQAQKPADWEQAVARHEATINDYLSYDYYFHGYNLEAERSFPSTEEASICTWMDEVLSDTSKTGNLGFMIRVEPENGIVEEGFTLEIFSRYKPLEARYQTGEELLKQYKAANPDIDGIGAFTFRIMPMIRVLGEKTIKSQLRDRNAYLKIEETYYLDGSPQVFPVAVRFDKLTQIKALRLNKIHLLGPSIGHPALLGGMDCKVIEEPVQADVAIIPSRRIVISEQVDGLDGFNSIMLSPWYQPVGVDEDVFVSNTDDCASNELQEPSIGAVWHISESDRSSPALPHVVLAADAQQAMPEVISEPSSHHEDPLGEITEIITTSSKEVEETSGQVGFDSDIEALFSEEDAISGQPPAADEPSMFGSKKPDFDRLKLFALSHRRERPDIKQVTQAPAEQIDSITDILAVATDIVDEQRPEVMQKENLIGPEIADSSPVQPPALDELPESGDSFDSWEDIVDETAHKLDQEEEFDPWLDESELEEKLNEAPDAYSEETESDSPTVIREELKAVVAPPVSRPVQAEPASSVVSQISNVSHPQPKESSASESAPLVAKKGGLASFLKIRKKLN